MILLNIEENDSNQRLDKFLCKLFKNSSRSLIFKLNRKNKVKIKNKGSEKYRKYDIDYKIQIGDEIKLFISEDEFKELSKSNDDKNVFNKNKKELDIVYEDDFLLVVNKDAGIDVHPGDFKTKDLSLIDIVKDYLGEKNKSLTFSPSLVHRIDRDTSGLILIAKKKDILTKLVQDFKENKNIEKIYMAFVFGKLKNKSGVINKKLLRVENAKNENKVQVSENGKKAITIYKVVGEYELETKNGKETISILEVKIKTGRMHQIRVHLSYLGNPIIGDNRYGDKKKNAYIAKELLLKRQALHSKEIELFHYGINRKLIFEAPLKKDMQKFLSAIKSLK